MGLPTNTQTEWGYYVTGDTDLSAVIWEGRRYVQAMVFVPVGASDTVEVTTTKDIKGAYTPVWNTGGAGVAVVQQEVRFDGNIPMDNPKVKLSAGGGKLYIYLRSR